MPATWDEIRTFGLSLPHASWTTSHGSPAVGVHDQDTVLLGLEHAELDPEVEQIITEAWRIAEIHAEQARAL
jgi:hypothetical protein